MYHTKYIALPECLMRSFLKVEIHIFQLIERWKTPPPVLLMESGKLILFSSTRPSHHRVMGKLAKIQTNRVCRVFTL